MHPFQLLEDQLSVVDEGGAGWGRANAATMALKERRAETLFHQPNSLAGGCQRHVGPRSTMRDACSLDHE
jgi:hypothetical protein